MTDHALIVAAMRPMLEEFKKHLAEHHQPGDQQKAMFDMLAKLEAANRAAGMDEETLAAIMAELREIAIDPTDAAPKAVQ